jgi:hypothetical protein
MLARKIFVLASSLKNKHRCIAGREVSTDEYGQNRFGFWIRPVSEHDSGAVSLAECRMDDNQIPSALDVIEIQTGPYEADPLQPENWIIQQDLTWHHATCWRAEVAANLVEEPLSLWLEPGIETDRVTSQYLGAQKELQSLYLVRPDSFEIHIRTDRWEGEEKKKRRAVFHYNDICYDLALTDPSISDKYFPNFHHEPDRIVHLRNEGNCLLCISYTADEYQQGYHFKVVASVIEL